ncbi:MAG: TFIIB-type zinc ribbon-containing protein [archaeon]
MKVCPNCGSTEIEYASLDKRSGEFVGIGVPQKYFCKNCGYTGSVIIETKKYFRRKPKILDYEAKTWEKSSISRIFVFSILFFLAASLVFLGYQKETSTEKVEGLLKILNVSEPKQGSLTILPMQKGYLVYKETGEKLYVPAKAIPWYLSTTSFGYGAFLDIFIPFFFMFFVAGLIAFLIGISIKKYLALEESEEDGWAIKRQT